MAYGAFAAALNHWQASRVSAVLALTPLSTLAFSVLAEAFWPDVFHAERISWTSLAGAAAVVGGSLLVTLAGRRTPRILRGAACYSVAMICPVCRDEYRPGFTRCATCDVDLVAELTAASPGAPAAPSGPRDGRSQFSQNEKRAVQLLLIALIPSGLVGLLEEVAHRARGPRCVEDQDLRVRRA